MKPNQQLRYERELRGWSQAKVAEEIGTTAVNVGRWERGVSFPYPYFREKLCVLFSKDAQALGLLQEADVEEVDTSPSEESLAAEALLQGGIYDPTIPLPPAGNGWLVGRATLLDQLLRRLCTEDGLVLAALNGLPGVGKTALAVTLATERQVRTHFSDGVLWAGLGPQPNVLGLLSHWGTLLGVTSKEMSKLRDREAWAMALRSAIGLRRMLLVIDDAWQLEEALTLQVGGPHCAYLLTTRFPYIAVAFGGDCALVVPELSETEGISLLARFVPEFVAQEPVTARDLVRCAGGLPLALTLMGKALQVQAYSGQPRRLYTAVEGMQETEQRLRLSTAYSGTQLHPSLPGGTAQSLEAIIAVSDQQLDAHEQAALRALSVLPAKPNSFSEEAALAVCQVAVEVLDALSDAGLLESGGPGRYTLHQTIADYAHAHLEGSGPRERLIEYGIRYAEEHVRDYEALEQDSSMLFLALEAAYQLGRQAELVRGACAFANFLQMRGLYLQAEKHLQRAYEAATSLQDFHSVTTVLLHLGETVQKRGDYVQAQAYLQEGLALVRQNGHRDLMGILLSKLGGVTARQGNYGQAQAYLQEGLTLARQLGNREQLSTLLSNLGALGAIATWHGDYEQAETYLQEGLALARQFNRNEGISGLLMSLGEMAAERGNYRQAETYLQEGLALARRLGYPKMIGSLLSDLGVVAVKQGDDEQADAYLQEGLTLARQLGHSELIITLLRALGIATTERGDYEQAEAYLQEGLTLARQLGHSELISTLLSKLGAVAAKQGDYEQADAYLQEGLALAQQVGRPLSTCAFLIIWGDMQIKQQQLDVAATTFREMLTLIPAGSQEPMAEGQYGLARVALAQGNILEARNLGEASLAIFEGMGHRRTSDMRRWLETLPVTSRDCEEKDAKPKIV